jgi:hypothetical protein
VRDAGAEQGPAGSPWGRRCRCCSGTVTVEIEAHQFECFFQFFGNSRSDSGHEEVLRAKHDVWFIGLKGSEPEA